MAAKKKAQKKAAGAARKMKKTAKKAASKARPKVSPVPKGYNSVSGFLVIDGAAEAIEFYKRAFGAKEKSRMAGPSGKIMHAELQIGDSMVMLSDEMPDMGVKSPKTVGGTTGGLMIYTKNVDALAEKAEKAGAKVIMPVQDQFWGDRYGQFEDPFGHRWSMGTRKENLTNKQIGKRAQEFFAKMGGGRE
jgi:PhnB protein